MSSQNKPAQVRVLGKIADMLAHGIPNSKLVVLPGERHSYFYTEPQKVHEIIREFLREN